MNVGAGQYRSSKVAITILPTIPPKRAATIDIATPVALKQKEMIKHYCVGIVKYVFILLIKDITDILEKIKKASIRETRFFLKLKFS